MEKQVLMIGSTVADVLIRVDHLPALEEDVNPFGQSLSLGGCCFNAANILELYGVPNTLFSPVGSGIFGDYIREQLKKYGRTPFLCPGEESGCCYCIIDAKGNRTFLAVHGAEYRFKKEWFDELDGNRFSDVYICGLELEEDSGVHIISFLKENPQLNIYFAPSARILHVPEDRMDAVLAMHPMLHLNCREAYAWLCSRGKIADGIHDPEVLIHSLFECTGNTVFLTDGADGAYAYDGTQLYFEPAVPVHAVDGTGAGDCHIGTLIACLSQGKSIPQAMREAAMNSAGVVCCQGALLSREQFQLIHCAK